MKRYKHLLALIFSLASILICLSTGSAKEVIQTQYGPDGIEVDLIRAKCSSNHLSVVFIVRNPGEARKSFSVLHDQVNIVDGTGAKKYHVLRDSKEEWLATNGTEDRVHFNMSPGESNTAWYKFPLPPENEKTIQIHLGEITPFEDVEIQR